LLNQLFYGQKIQLDFGLYSINHGISLRYFGLFQKTTFRHVCHPSVCNRVSRSQPQFMVSRLISYHNFGYLRQELFEIPCQYL